MATQLVAITGNTYPVKDSLKALGARWNPDQKAWMVSTDLADRARQIVSGTRTSSAPSSPSPTPGLCSDKQRMTIRKLLRRVENVHMFDSFSGNGASYAADVEDEIEKSGGIEKLTSRKASEIISGLISAIDDEM